MDLSNITIQNYLENTDAINEQLKHEVNINTIPLIDPVFNVGDDKNKWHHKLVRFRGMIQDMKDPEIYLEKYKVTTPTGSEKMINGIYRDTMVLEVCAEKMVLNNFINICSLYASFSKTNKSIMIQWIMCKEKEDHFY